MSSDNIHIVLYTYFKFSTVAAEKDFTNPFNAGIVHSYFTHQFWKFLTFQTLQSLSKTQTDIIVFQSKDLKLKAIYSIVGGNH